jgi:hypothetical protein
MSTETQETVHSYVTDMLALEEHIVKAIQAQVEVHEEEYPTVTAELRIIQATVEGHITALKGLDAAREGGALQGIGEAIKRMGSTLAGFGAAAIDLVRSEKLAKNLRDDATAFSLAHTGYLMLHTTARALGDARTAELAASHLTAYAQMIMRVNHLIPAAVVEVLRAEELRVDAAVVPEVLEVYRKAWTA